MDLHTFKLAAATPQRSNSLKSMVEFPYTPETPTAKLCQQFESVHLQTPIAAEAYLPTPQSDTYVLNTVFI
jgi:hypothetical protein